MRGVWVAGRIVAIIPSGTDSIVVRGLWVVSVVGVKRALPVCPHTSGMTPTTDTSALRGQ